MVPHPLPPSALKPACLECWLIKANSCSHSPMTCPMPHVGSYPDWGVLQQVTSICSRESGASRNSYTQAMWSSMDERVNLPTDETERMLEFLLFVLHSHYFTSFSAQNMIFQIKSPLSLHLAKSFQGKGIQTQIILRDWLLLIVTSQILLTLRKTYGLRRVQEELNWIWNVRS